MRQLLRHYFVIIVCIYAVTQIIPAIAIQNSWRGIFYAAAVLSLLLYITKPIINLIMLPINLLTLNLASWLINIIIVYIWVLLDKDVRISAWEFSGFTFGPISLASFNFGVLQTIIISAILLTLLERFFSWLIK